MILHDTTFDWNWIEFNFEKKNKIEGSSCRSHQMSEYFWGKTMKCSSVLRKVNVERNRTSKISEQNYN